jgi:signal transduction histidine kinase
MKRVFLSFYVFIVFSMLFVQFGLGPIIDKVAELYLHESVIEYYRKLSQGVFYMMEQDLLRLPKEMWSERIKELKPQFGYNISLLPYYELDLPQEQLTQLRQSKIAMAEEGDFLYRQVGNSEMVIEKGPLLVLEPNSRFLTLATWIAIIVIYALLTFIWIIPYCWKLRKISGAATAFGNGNFNIRVDISKRSSLTSIAQAFNTMAKRIQQLIDSHKELTNAVSHELRTPLSRLRFGLEMLETAENQEKRSHYARGLQTDVTELEDLVSELLTFARFDREKPDLQFDVHHLDSFLRQLLAESVPDESDIRYQLHCHLQELSGLVCFEPNIWPGRSAI